MELFLAAIIFLSWMGNTNVLAYMGFMRGRITKALFLLYCGAMTYPKANTSGVRNVAWLSDIYVGMSYVLMFASILQLLKFFNRNQSDIHGTAAMKNMQY